MPTTDQWVLFLGSAAVFALLPGPGMLYVLARSLRGGRPDGIRSVCGNSVGATVHAVAAALGLSALLAASAEAFTVVKLVGAAYLLYLGVRALSRPPSADIGEPDVAQRRGAFVSGILSEVLNPKTAIYFLAFLPHFVDITSPSAPFALLLLGIVAVLTATLADLLVALGAGAISVRLAHSARLRAGQRWVPGLLLIGIGGALAIAEAD